MRTIVGTRGEVVRLSAVLVAALVVRLALAVCWEHRLPDDQTFVFPDSESYWELAQHVARGEAYEFRSPERRVFRSPGYPLLLAGMFRVVGADASPLAARLLGAVLGTLTVGAVYWLGRCHFDAKVATWAALVVAFYPGAIATSVFVLADGAFCLWMILQLVFWHRAATSHDQVLTSAAIAGGLAGVATLTRPSWLLFTPLGLLIQTIFGSGRRRHMTVAMAMLVALAAVMLPWWIRNWQVTGQFVPTTLQVGASLYDGLNPQADGGSDMRFVERFERQLRSADANHLQEHGQLPAVPFEVRLDRMMRDAALEWAGDHPGRVLELAAIKFARLWNVWPNEPSFRRWPLRLAVAVSFITVMALAALGTWCNRQRLGELSLLIAPAIYFTLLQMVFVGSLRYRQPAMLTLAVLAAAGWVSLWTARRQRLPPAEQPKNG